MNTPTCVRIGFGTVAPLHEAKLKGYAETVGILDISDAKKKDIVAKGFRSLESYKEVTPDFWDICTPPETHLSVIEKIVEVNPNAHIVVEKPVCLIEQIPRLREVLSKFHGKLVVNENYLSSQIAEKVKELAFDTLTLTPRRICVEMDKNCTRDFQAGRYRDPAGAFGYEGTHMITILQSLGSKFFPKPDTKINRRFEDIEIPQRLEKQGTAEISYGVDGVAVSLFTSMKGDIKHRYAPHCPKGTIPESDTATRYRVIAIEGIDSNNESCTVVGFYEPIQGLMRSQGTVAVLQGDKVTKILEPKVTKILEPFEDDTMGKHLRRAVVYFQDGKENPCTVEKGIETVQLLHTLTKIIV